MGKYLEKVKKIHIEALKVSQQEANETFRGLNIQLIFIAAAVLSFSLLIFLNKDITGQVNLMNFGKMNLILILTWILLGLSILFGIIQFFITYNFFKEHSGLQAFLVNKFQDDNEVEQIKKELNIYTEEQEEEMNKIYEGIVDKLVYEKIKEEAIKKYPKVLPESSELWIKIQAFLLISSFALLIYFMVALLV